MSGWGSNNRVFLSCRFHTHTEQSALALANTFLQHRQQCSVEEKASLSTLYQASLCTTLTHTTHHHTPSHTLHTLHTLTHTLTHPPHTSSACSMTAPSPHHCDPPQPTECGVWVCQEANLQRQVLYHFVPISPDPSPCSSSSCLPSYSSSLSLVLPPSAPER